MLRSGSVFALICISWAQVVVRDNCLGCICEAATGCNRTIGVANGLSGPFGISLNYWKDAGAPENNFENCTNDVPCAAETVTNYMKQYQTDCNQDSKIDCKDFARIHYLGAGCQGTISKEYITSFNKCLKTIKKMKLKI